MFRKVYKNANQCIDTAGAYQRVQRRILWEKRKNSYLRPIASMVACFVIIVAGISAYQFSRPKVDGTDNLVMPANEGIKTARIQEPVYDETADVALTESKATNMLITEESKENFKKITKDSSYKNIRINDAEVYEKTEENTYECWIEKEGKITKISAVDISEEEKQNIINSITQ